jgi:hypothetical protein
MRRTLLCGQCRNGLYPIPPVVPHVTVAAPCPIAARHGDELKPQHDRVRCSAQLVASHGGEGKTDVMEKGVVIDPHHSPHP